MAGDVSWLNRPLQTWFQDAKFRPYPLQPKLDCDGCTKSLRSESHLEQERWKKWKCCAFQPFVANYLLGAMLETKPLPKNINAQFVMSPLGMCPSPDYRSRFLAKEDLVRGEDLICAFYDKERRNCTNWQHRPSECATYFCEKNSFFQSRSQDLFDWEIAVAQMALVEHGYSPKQIEELMNEMNGNAVTQVENKIDFYKSCWNWARQRTGAEILSWLAPEAQARFDSWVRFA